MVTIAGLVVAVGLWGIAATLAPATANAGTTPAGSFNVMNYGAAADGVTNDAGAVQAAVDAAGDAGGGTVVVPAGSYSVGSTVHLRSNVIVQLAAGATLTGTSTGYDAPETNPNDSFQDFGHSHFHDAMFYGDGLSNAGFTGSGTIDGGGHFITGNPKTGQADKLISLTHCTNLTMNGITLARGGHFAILINGCDGVKSDHLNIQTAGNRDGWNVINTSHATFSNITVAANDDALVFKSDWALGQRFTNQGNVTVANAHLSAQCCNALMFGSETCSDFAHYNFSNITVTSAGKSGLGMVSMDGANISDVHYNNVTMSGTASPITIKVGNRKRCGDNPGIGSVSNVTYNNVTGTGAGSFSPTLWGQPGYPVSGVTFNNLDLTLPGGVGPTPVATPSDNGDYNPNSLGTRPAFGFYLHNVDGITYNNGALRLASPDARPAFLADGGNNVKLNNVRVDRGTGSPFDFGFLGVTGFCLSNPSVSAGGAARIDSDSGSTASCHAPTRDFSVAAAPAAQTVNAGSAATYTVNTATLAGSPGNVTLAVAGLPAGATATFDPATVPAGNTATLTVNTTDGTPPGTSTLTVLGTANGVTHSANVALTVKPEVIVGVLGDLAVSDATNAAAWSIQNDLEVGDTLYGDRTFTIASLPAALPGAQWIRAANASKTNTSDPLVTFTLSRDATVYLGVDTRVGKRPFMDASWVDTGTQVTDAEGSSTRRFEMYQKAFPAGPVALGPDADTANSGSMYLVMVR